MNEEIIVNGIKFYKSSFSPFGGKCVGVSIHSESVFVVNTKQKDVIIKFTKEEWIAFVKGVKNNEFDFKE